MLVILSVNCVSSLSVSIVDRVLDSMLQVRL